MIKFFLFLFFVYGSIAHLCAGSCHQLINILKVISLITRVKLYKDLKKEIEVYTEYPLTTIGVLMSYENTRREND